MIEDSVGLPSGKRKTRRGKRRKATRSEHEEHMAEMKRCVDCKDHKGAKNAAFKFIKSMPAEEAMEYAVEMEEKDDSPKKGKLSPAMMAYLKKKK